MVAFKWNKYFITGYAQVDKEHQKLVSIVNKLGVYTIKNKIDDIDFDEILKELLDYTIYHFKSEEDLMSEFKLDHRHISKHKKIHNNFISDIKIMVGNLNTNTGFNPSELFTYLMNWLVYHILGIDQEMAKQANLIKEGTKPKEAYNIMIDNKSSITEPLLYALKGLFEQISGKNAKLLELNKTLEKKVFERTKELAQMNKKLKNQSLTDELTELKNRRYALKYIKELWENKDISNISCMMIDADNFKIINDTYGHDAGDIVLKRLATSIEQNIGKTNTVCRLGGDEFLVICPNVDMDNCIKMAQRLLEFINTLKVEVNGGSWLGSISIGLATKDSSTKDYEELIKTTDLNVYEAKSSGKNCIRY